MALTTHGAPTTATPAGVSLVNDASTWDDLVDARGGHPLQCWGWGELKSGEHWRALRLAVYRNGEPIGGAQVLQRSLPGPLRPLLYVPRGPFADHGEQDEVTARIAQYCRDRVPATVLTIEPDTTTGPSDGPWRRTSNTILIPRTLILDLTRSEEALLSAMAKKTRQYIRKSGREGLDLRLVTTPEGIDQALSLYRETADRAGFAVHGEHYYQDVAARLGARSRLYTAYDDGQPVAFLWLAASRRTAFELYGGMNERGQALRANYTLKWHAIRECQRDGIERYDLNGLLNNGITTFKTGFADHEDLLAGTFDLPLSPIYPLWARGLPAAKRVVRAARR